MPDDLKRKGPEDRNTISTQDHELKYWAHKFGITVEQLKAAIRAVGNSVVNVKAELKRKRLI